MALLGKADSTLVQGAYKVAAANMPGDMSQIYKQREQNVKKLTESIQKAWDNQFEAYNALETRITEASDLAIANVLEGKKNDSMLAAVDNEVRAIKSVMQGFDKRDKGNLEWKKLEARINKLATTSKNNDAIWSDLIDLSANGDLHIAGTGPEIDLYEALINDYNNNTNLTNGQIVDGDFLYSLPGNPDVTMTMQQLKKNLMIKDDTAPSNIMTVVNGVMKTSSTTNRPWDDEYQSDTRNLIRNHLKTANDRTNVIHHRFPGMKNSVYDYLANPSLNPDLTAEIHSALLTLDTDIDNDGVTDDATTYANPDNINALKREIINNASSQDFLANVLTDVIGENSYGRGKDMQQEQQRKSSGGGSGGGSGSGGGKNTSGNRITGNVKVGKSRTGGSNTQISVPVEQVDAKYNEIVNAHNGNKPAVVEGWEGGRDYQYVWEPGKGGKNGFWRYQIFDQDLQQFRTYGGLDKDDEYDKKGNKITDVEVKHLTTDQLLSSSHLNINKYNSNAPSSNNNTASGEAELD